MSIHHGARLLKLIEKSGKEITDIAKKTGVVRGSIYNYFDYEDLPRKKVKPILDYLKIDIEDFYNEKNIVKEDEQPYTLRERIKDLESQVAVLKEQVADKNQIIAMMKAEKNIHRSRLATVK